MALIKLTASELEGVQSQISKMSSKASDCANKVSSVRNGLDMEISAKRNIEERLDNIKRDLTKHSESLKLHANVLNDVINEFVRTDSSGSILQSATSITDWMNGIIAGGTIGGAIAGGIYGGIPMSHTGEMYNWQTQQQLEKICNVATICADSSLKKEETGFWGNLWNKGKEAVESIGDKAKKLYGNVVQAGKDCVSWVGDRIDDAKDWYNENEEQIKAYGATALKIGSATVKLVGAAVAIGTGAGVPMGIISAMTATNDIINAHADLVYIEAEQYENVGTTNVLKDYLKDSGKQIGGYFGNEDVGETLGSALYTGINVVTFLDGADKMLTSMGKANTVLTGEYGSSSGWFWDWKKTSFEAINNTKLKFSLEPDYFIRKLMKINPASDGNIIYEAGKNVYKMFGKAFKLGNELGNYIK